MKEICAWVHDLISTHLHDEYKKIKVLAELLTLNDSPSTYPFPGFVLNLQVCTAPHLDSGDGTFCVVIPFGTWENGELVLYEAGLVLDLKAGDIIIFPSFKLTHFNLNFQGVRCSVVMHVDKAGRSWAKDRRGWFTHIVM